MRCSTMGGGVAISAKPNLIGVTVARTGTVGTIMKATSFRSGKSVSLVLSCLLIFLNVADANSAGMERFEISSNDIEIFSYADKITRMGCMSIETALLSGWKYNLIGPGMKISYGGGGLNNKIFAMSLVANSVDPNSSIIYADAFDVIYQGAKSDFITKSPAISLGNSKIVYSAESNCYPFRRVDANFYCELMSGAEFVNNHRGSHGEGGPFRPGEMRPLACAKLDAMIPPEYEGTVSRYLNSGLSYGTGALYARMANATDAMYKVIPKSCQDDQAVLSWLMATETMPITLDYSSALFGSHYNQDYHFDDASCLWKNTRDSSHPSVIHHNGPKHRFATHRQQLIECEFKGNDTAYAAFIDSSTFTVNGKIKKFGEVCTGDFDPEPKHYNVPNNTPIRGDCSKETFMFQNNTLRSFPSANVFYSWGLDFSEVKVVSCDVVNFIPRGPPMQNKA